MWREIVSGVWAARMLWTEWKWIRVWKGRCVTADGIQFIFVPEQCKPTISQFNHSYTDIDFTFFWAFEQNDVVVFLCQSCTDHLMIAYKFAQQVKLADQRFKLKLQQIEVAATNADDCKLNDLVELLEADDDSEIEKSASKRTRKMRRPNETAVKRMKRDSSPKNPIHSDVPVNFALPHYVITSNAPDDDEQFDENATNPSELERQLLDDEVDGQTLKYEIETSSTRSNVKTLNTSAIVTSNLEQIVDLCAITIDGDHDSQSIYQCKYCPKAFAGPYHLMIHTRKSHQCQYCLSAFVKVTDLSKHVKETHNSFDCLLCGRVFRTNGNLRQHMRKNHSVFLPAHVSLLNANEATNNDDTGQTLQ